MNELAEDIRAVLEPYEVAPVHPLSEVGVLLRLIDRMEKALEEAGHRAMLLEAGWESFARGLGLPDPDVASRDDVDDEGRLNLIQEPSGEWRVEEMGERGAFATGSCA